MKPPGKNSIAPGGRPASNPGTMMTVIDVLRAATDFLQNKGVESPRLNAEHLLAHCLGLERLQLYLEFDRLLGEDERLPLRELVRRRGNGHPLQHLLGTAAFFGRDFLCDARALIPRPETEQLVGHVLTSLPAGAVRVADVGTGSGVVAITLALERPGLDLAATDCCPAALALACENAVRLGAAIAFFPCDLLEPGMGPFDAIVANLPYIPAAELGGLSREVLCDPVTALDGGDDGMAIIRRLIGVAGSFLSPGGFLALEIGHGQEGELSRALAGHNFRDICTLPDYQGVTRFLIAHHG